MLRPPSLVLLKRGLLFFWALWLSIVCATNVLDGLKALAVLPPTWSLASGNYAFMVKVTAIHQTPSWLVDMLFAGVVLWEALGALLFWRAFFKFRGLASGFAPVVLAFSVTLALWAGFIIADEVFISYQVEDAHRSIFLFELVTLLVVRLLPDE